MTYIALRIEKMPSGGFVVAEAYDRNPQMCPQGPLFASTTIGEALDFIKGQLAPPISGDNSTAPAKCETCGSAGMFRYCGRRDCIGAPVAGENWSAEEIAAARAEMRKAGNYF
ncbi:hypothetical protein [Bradyrhizobium sp. USDA 4452]